MKAPARFSPDHLASSKRKRDDEDGGLDENGAPTDGEPTDGEDDDEEDDEPAPTRRRKPASSQANGARKPAAKKPKTNGASSAMHLPSRPKKRPVQVVTARQEGDKLFGRRPL